MERTTEDGREVSYDDGTSWVLVEPSQAWLDAQAQIPDPPAPTETPASDPSMLAKLADVAAALRDPLANLTPFSESTTVRTAILNQRAALDALLTDINESVDMTTGVRTVVVDNGDGTGTRTTYDEHGNVTSVEQLTGLPIPDLPADPDLIPPDPTQLRSPR